MKQGYKRKTLLTVIWLSFIFLLLQASGFILFNFTTVRSVGSYGYPNGMFVWHPTLNYLYKPGFSGRFTGGAYQDISFVINGDGFRDDPFKPHSSGKRRIIFLGDSVVFGSGVWEEDRFTEQLQADEAMAGAGIEVLNLGVNSYNFGHYLELARLRFMGLGPDLAIVGFTLNDIQTMERVWPNKQVRPPKGHVGPKRKGKWYSKPLWLNRIQKSMGRTYAGRFVEYTGEVIRRRLMSREKLEDYQTKWMRSAVRYWHVKANRERLRSELLQFREVMFRQGVPFAFLLFPEKNDLLDPEEYSFPRESIIGLLDELHIDYCDAYDTFASRPDIDSLYLVNDSVHFTPAGHALIKDVLVACGEAGDIPLLAGKEGKDQDSGL